MTHNVHVLHQKDEVILQPLMMFVHLYINYNLLERIRLKDVWGCPRKWWQCNVLIQTFIRRSFQEYPEGVLQNFRGLKANHIIRFSPLAHTSGRFVSSSLHISPPFLYLISKHMRRNYSSSLLNRNSPNVPLRRWLHTIENLHPFLLSHRRLLEYRSDLIRGMRFSLVLFTPVLYMNIAVIM